MKAFVFLALFCGLSSANIISEECLRGVDDRFECCKNIPDNVLACLKNPADCTTYYQCKHSKPEIQHCPEGQHWSVEKEECRPPAEAKCTENPCNGPCKFKKPIQLVSAQIRITDECEPEPVCHRCIDGFYPPDICCQTYKTYYKLRLADGKDPKSYYQCVNEKPVHHHCPDQLVWSSSSDRCEFPADASKIEFSVGSSLYFSDKVRSRRCGSGEAAFECLAGHANHDQCCAEAGLVDDMRLQNNNDCQSYYQCKNGKAQLKKCDDGLFWSSDAKECVAKEKSTCQN